MVEAVVGLLADVAVLVLDQLAELRVVLDVGLLEPEGRLRVRRGVDGLVAQDADAGLGGGLRVAF